MKENNVDILTCEYVKIRYAEAGLGKRIGAFLLDTVLYYFFLFFIVCIVLDAFRGYGFSFIVTLLSLITIFRNMIMEYVFKGRTLGKYIMRIKVINDECAPPNLLQCFLRHLMFSIDSFFFIGIVLISKTNQRLGDMASGCHVVLTRNTREEKVNLDEDFKYTEPNYKVCFTNADQLTPHDVQVINNVLYNNVYFGGLDYVVKQLQEKTKIKPWSSNIVYLKTLINDYNYLTQVASNENNLIS